MAAFFVLCLNELFNPFMFCNEPIIILPGAIIVKAFQALLLKTYTSSS